MFLSQIDTEQIIQGIKSLKLRHNQAVAILLGDKGRPDLESLVQELAFSQFISSTPGFRGDWEKNQP